MDPQMKKGLLDPCVLAVIEKGDAYGYSLTQQTVALLGVSESSLYPVLRRLEQQGCFETYNAEYNGRLRKYYRMTETGRQKLAASREDMQDLYRIIEFIMHENGEGPKALPDGRSQS